MATGGYRVTSQAEPELVLEDLAPDGELTLTWNRPDRKNAWTPDLEFAYFAALDRAQAQAAVRAVVVTGSGNAFCPGLDMQRLAKISGEGKLSIADRRPQYTPRLFNKPLIAAINGPCAGIGLVQALMADVRFAGTGARFSTAFTRRGLGPEYGMAWVLPRLIGVANAMDLLLSARTFGAEEAKEYGLINRLLPPEEVLPAAQAYAGDLARNCSPEAMAFVRREVYDGLDLDFREALRRSLRSMSHLNAAPDFKEGVSSFVEKRPPQFASLDDGFDADEVLGAATEPLPRPGD
jgi:enoyl-CoA hydratase/carnithine racemase